MRRGHESFDWSNSFRASSGATVHYGRLRKRLFYLFLACECPSWSVLFRQKLTALRHEDFLLLNFILRLYGHGGLAIYASLHLFFLIHLVSYDFRLQFDSFRFLNFIGLRI